MYNMYVIEFFCFFHSLACLQNYSGGLLWPTSRRDRVVTQSCSTLHPTFRSRVSVGRKCNEDGTWGPVDYSNCTALDNAIPTMTISFIVNVSLTDADAIAYNVSIDTLVGIKCSKTSLIINPCYIEAIVFMF